MAFFNPGLWRAFVLALFAAWASGVSAQTVDVYPTADVPGFPTATLPFTIEIKVHNDAAPGVVASGVMVTNTLPPGLTLVDCSVASYIQRNNSFLAIPPYHTASWTNYGNVVVVDAGSIANGYYRPITITAVAATGGTFNNQIVARSNGTDSSPANNVISHSILVHSNALSVVGGESVSEASGSNLVFQVQLAPASSVGVSVDYTTINGTAVAGQDFVAATGNLYFPPGVTNKWVSVQVLDDALDEESSQSFTLALANAVNAEINPFSQSNSIVDDETDSVLSISDAPAVLENDSVTNLVFPLQLTMPMDAALSVQYVVTGAVSSSGFHLIPAGATTDALPVKIVGDLDVTSNRTVGVNLLSCTPTRAIGTAHALGTILEDDGQPGEFHHIELSPVPSPQIVGRPFTITYSAFDAFDNPATNYTVDAVQLVAYRLFGSTVQTMDVELLTNFVNGSATATIVYTNTATNAYAIAWKPVGDPSGGSYVTASTPQFQVVASPWLFISIPPMLAEGYGVVTGRIFITNIDVQDIVVELTSNDPSEFTVPPSVTIPAGQTFADFDLTIVDDDLLDGSINTSVTVSSPGYVGLSRFFFVHDNDSAVLTLTLPVSVSEAKGFSSGPLVVSVDRAPINPIFVSLLSSDTTELTVPSGVYIQAGSTSATSFVTAVNDALMDGPQEVTVTARVTNWVDGVASMIVLDDDTNLIVSVILGNATAVEGLGTVSNSLRVTVTGVSSNDIPVTLSSSDTSEVIVPTELVIPAGLLGVTNHIAFPDDVEFDGTQTVTVTASSPGLESGTRNILVFDDDVHHITFAPIPTVRTSEVPFAVSFTTHDVNDVVMTWFRGTVDLSTVRAGPLLPINPTIASNIVRGVWNGNVTIRGWGSDVQLLATATNGISGLSNPFDLLPPGWAENFLLGDTTVDGSGVSFSFNTVTGKVYQVEYSTNLTGTWFPLGDPIPGTGGEVPVFEPVGAANRFFRVSTEP